MEQNCDDQLPIYKTQFLSTLSSKGGLDKGNDLKDAL